LADTKVLPTPPLPLVTAMMCAPEGLRARTPLALVAERVGEEGVSTSFISMHAFS